MSNPLKTIKKRILPIPDRGKAPRLADIAKAAGVSPGVVSSFFNNKIYGVDRNAVIGIGDKTKERVLQACRALDYRPADPALLARIYPEQSDVVFFLNERVAEGMQNSFFSLILEGIGCEAAKAGVNISYCRFSPQTDYLANAEALPAIVRGRSVLKYIVAGDINYSLLLSLRQANAGVVYVNRAVALERVVSVVADYYSAAYTGVKALFDAGRTPVAVVAEAYFRGRGYHNVELVRGAQAAFKEQGIPFSAEDVAYKAASGPADAAAAIRPLLRRKPRPRGIFCFDDWTAHCVYRALGEAGLRVPDDVSVIGCNDDRTASYMSPPLTTVHLPAREIGRRAYLAVSDLAAGKTPSEEECKIVLPVEMVLRDSVKGMKAGISTQKQLHPASSSPL